MMTVVKSGRNQRMRYLKKTHRVSVAWLHERFKSKDFELVYEVSCRMAADIYTKAFGDALKWAAVCGLINIFDPKILKEKGFWIDRRADSPSQSGGGFRSLKHQKVHQPSLVGMKMMKAGQCRLQKRLGCSGHLCPSMPLPIGPFVPLGPFIVALGPSSKPVPSIRPSSYPMLH